MISFSLRFRSESHRRISECKVLLNKATVARASSLAAIKRVYNALRFYSSPAALPLRDPMTEQPYFAPLSSGHPAGFTQHDRAEASRIAADERMSRDAALGRPLVARPELPPIKEPVLPDNFAQRLAQLDEAISERGVAIDRERLVSLGRMSVSRSCWPQIVNAVRAQSARALT